MWDKHLRAQVRSHRDDEAACATCPRAVVRRKVVCAHMPFLEGAKWATRPVFRGPRGCEGVVAVLCGGDSLADKIYNTLAGRDSGATTLAYLYYYYIVCVVCIYKYTGIIMILLCIIYVIYSQSRDVKAAATSHARCRSSRCGAHVRRRPVHTSDPNIFGERYCRAAPRRRRLL